jgi:hypothetical protein
MVNLLIHVNILIFEEIAMIGKVRQFIFITILSFILLVSLWRTIAFAQDSAPPATPSTQIEANIPTDLSPCLPQSVEQIQLLGQVQQEEEQFYLLGLFVGDRYWESLVQRDRSGCLLVKGEQDTESLSAYVSIEIAQQLTLQRYQRRIEEAGGLEAFQQGFLEYMRRSQGGEVVYLAPESVWALQQLGVQIPEGTYQIRQPRTVPDFDPQGGNP